MNIGELSKQLIDALSEEPVNILRVRSLCRAYPGLIASAGLRLKAWSTLLLGSEIPEDVLNSPLEDPAVSCAEQHVLEADVHRTRAEVEMFRSEEHRQLVKNILQKFCVDHKIQYKQGMNEVLAPFMTIARPNGERLTFELFRAFLFRYLERFFCVDDSSFLFKAFRLFHLLLVYYDPQLAYHLHDLDFIPELYSPQWFLTLYARSLPIQHVLRLWDMMIAVDDPSFTFFIGLCMIRKQRTALLLGDVGNIPEIISNIQFKNEDEIDEVVGEALALYQMTPRCLLRHLRLCCVSTVELTPTPQLWALPNISSSPSKPYSSQPTSSMKVNIDEHDQQLSLQTVRNCMMITAQELVESMLPSNKHEELSQSATSYVPQQFVIIDIRSYEDSMASGGGILPRAINLEPEFLNRPDAFDVWLQHFDGTRGCNICIVDLPPTQWTGVALWRRLLLGEGDGLNKFRGRYEFDDVHENKRKLDALLAGVMGNKSASSSLDSQRTDSQSKYAKEEEEQFTADLNRPAMLLAIALQRHSFPHVSVLEGGFPALVEQLQSTRGTVEPIIINHDSEQWYNFLKRTGRYSDVTKGTSKKQQIKKSSPEAEEAGQWKGEKIIRSEKDLSEAERLEMAANVAEKLQHSYVLQILRDKLDSFSHRTPSEKLA